MHRIARKFRINIVESRFTPIIFALIAIFMRLALFLSVGIQQQEYPTSFVWQTISPLFSNNWISLISSTASIFIIAFIFSNLNLRYTLTRFRTSLPFALLLFVLSVHPLFLAMSPNYLSIIFILLAVSPMLESYQNHSPHNFAFKSGVLIAIAGTFQVFALAFLPLWWYGETSMHGFRVKSFIALLLGALLVFWNVAGLYFLFTNLQSFLVPFSFFDSINLALPHYTPMKWSVIGIVSLITIVLIILDTEVFKRERVLTQKTLTFIIIIVFSSIILHLLYGQQTFFFVHLFVNMLIFIVAHYFSYVKTRWGVYLFFFVFIGLFMIYINYLIGNPLLF